MLELIMGPLDPNGVSMAFNPKFSLFWRGGGHDRPCDTNFSEKCTINKTIIPVLYCLIPKISIKKKRLTNKEVKTETWPILSPPQKKTIRVHRTRWDDIKLSIHKYKILPYIVYILF